MRFSYISDCLCTFAYVWVDSFISFDIHLTVQEPVPAAGTINEPNFSKNKWTIAGKLSRAVPKFFLILSFFGLLSISIWRHFHSSKKTSQVLITIQSKPSLACSRLFRYVRGHALICDKFMSSQCRTDLIWWTTEHLMFNSVYCALAYLIYENNCISIIILKTIAAIKICFLLFKTTISYYIILV